MALTAERHTCRSTSHPSTKQEAPSSIRWSSSQPDFDELRKLDDVLGIIVTAPHDEYDFVSRFFAPRAGVPEDPVTGSAHCTLVPYWSARLGKKSLRAYQASSRGGELICEDRGERVLIGGRAVLYARGTIFVPEEDVRK